MNNTELATKIRAAIQKRPNEYQAYEDFYGISRLMLEDDKDVAVGNLKWLSETLSKTIPVVVGENLELGRKMMGLHRRCLLALAPHDFDSYLLFVEWNREPSKKFYPPRRHVLKLLVDDLQDLEDGKLDFLSISLPPRVGKLLADDTPIMTSEGWKRHGDLAVGDMVVGMDGEYKRVEYVFPKGIANYEVEFTNGDVIKCHGNHEWYVFNRHSRKYEIRTTKSMLDDVMETGEPNVRGHRYYFQMPFAEVMQGEEQDLPVDPYVLGAWLGDGTTNKPVVTICDTDVDIAIEFCKRGYGLKKVYEQVGCKQYKFINLRVDLQKLGLCDCRNARQKYIPELYLTASLKQRLDLLAGLIDTDGTQIEKGYIYSTSNKELCDGVCALISTFGWRYGVCTYEPVLSSSGIQGKRTVYAIKFYPTYRVPCKVSRKRINRPALRRKIAIKRITPVEPVQGNCIQVEGGMYRAGKTMIPTHNSTLCIFFMTWIMGKHPNDASVMSGHSDKLTDGFYRELLSIITDHNEYLWHEVFPGVRMVDTSAKNETIDLDRKKRFPTITCRSISGTLTGAVEVGSNGILYVDDAIEDLEESLNPLRLQAKFDAYLNQLKDRKKMGARELMVATRWNVLDIQGRLEEQYGDNPRYRFRVIPAINSEGHSNFIYGYNLGFDDAYYADMKASIDDATWNAKYMGRPYVRDGLLFPEDELLTYNGVLPDGEPLKLAVCDVAWGGGDSLSMIFAYVFGDNVYVHDVIFNRGDKDVTYPVVIGRVLQHMPNKIRFESNNGGTAYSEHVDEELRRQGVHINIFAKAAPNNQSKLGRIIQFSPDIKRFYFLDEKHRSKEYRAFMREMTTFVQTGKNPHDDSCDAAAMLADELYHNTYAAVKIVKRVF